MKHVKKLLSYLCSALIYFLICSPFAVSAQTTNSFLEDNSVRFAYKANSFTLPFRLLGDTYIGIKVLVNGRGPFLFILDTGFGGNIAISPEVARSLDLKKVDGTQRGIGLGADAITMSQIEAAVIQIGDVDLLNQRLNIAPLASVIEGIDGVLSYNFMKRFILEINYQNKTLTISKIGSPEAIAAATLARNSTIPLVLSNGQVPLIKVEIDGKVGTFEIDTGSPQSVLLFPSFIQRNNLREKYSNRISITGSGLGGQYRSEIARSNVLKIGGYYLHGMLIGLLQQRTEMANAIPIDGLIGAGVLNRFNILLSYNERYIKIDKNENFDKPDIFSRVGFLIEVSTGKVIDLLSNSAAAQAGIAIGDVIISIDDVPISALGLDGLLNKTTQAPGTSIKILLRKESSNNTVTINLILKDVL